MRACRRCGVEKPEKDFYLNANEYRPCKSCCREQRRAYHDKNKHKENIYAKEYQLIYYYSNKERVKSRAKDYYKKNRQIILDKRRAERRMHDANV